MSSSEAEFAQNFITLATLNKPTLSRDYKKPLSEVNQLGVALPPLKYRYRTRNKNTSSSKSSVKLTLKSVRPPKFSIQQDFNSHDTVTEVKQFLVNSEKVQQIGQLKLLLKGKVLHDSVSLSELDITEAVINVMVSKPLNVNAQSSTSGPGSYAHSMASTTDANGNTVTIESRGNDEVKVSYSQTENGNTVNVSTSSSGMNIPTSVATSTSKELQVPWMEIEILLKSRCTNIDEVNKTLQRLKRGWELASD
ncbi:hypothetical protein TBLA_0B08480 [Henningerozyma blattae CBS 6284]|uniref:Ubiquitin-like domain-containing protein n=1 Tax=Henningerozyma blattae (strain ATCC 34711 / CBS 6284 / DSM 70876 / NBRC 10599 / NRRL Y-10934 / UCD 77-7) TaxID=1071380 RepID=I2GZW1_HENB6|nr:hypothetical protein TBLA_0B08480 [Tetrapisispora blattae CBS 6284]CCH59663.1 hypothetical protein TBLA_0B08480 [Tetrapisispora blattae CBS 6284]